MDTNKVKLLKELLNDYDPSLLEYVDDDELNAVNSFDDLYSLLESNSAFDVVIIGYKKAINYLAEHDPSLKNSVEIAMESGYKIEDVNSELLANNLAVHNNPINFTYFVRPKYDELFPNL